MGFNTYGKKKIIIIMSPLCTTAGQRPSPAHSIRSIKKKKLTNIPSQVYTTAICGGADF